MEIYFIFVRIEVFEDIDGKLWQRSLYKANQI